MTIVAVLGASGAGKSAVCDRLCDDYGFTRIRFAQYLKDMLAAFGLSHEDLYGSQVHRSQPHPLLCGKSSRHAMQTLGGEWRDTIARDLWVRRLEIDVNAILQDNPRARLVIEDLRHKGPEIEMLRRLNGYTIAIRRPSVEPTPWSVRVSNALARLPIAHGIKVALARAFGAEMLHESERQWYDLEHDFTIHNLTTFESFMAGVDRAMAGIELREQMRRIR